MTNRSGRSIGSSSVLLGGKSGDMSDPANGLHACLAIGDRQNMEDGAVLASIADKKAHRVRLIGLYDGLGGTALGEMASSVAGQSADAHLRETVQEGGKTHIIAVAQAMKRALDYQREYHRSESWEDRTSALGQRDPDSCGAVAMVSGDRFWIAHTGDVLALLQDENGKITHFIDLDVTIEKTPDRIVERLRSTIGNEKGRFFQGKIRSGQRLLLLTDGFAALVLKQYKEYCGRREEGSSVPPDFFKPLEDLIAGLDSASIMKKLEEVAKASPLSGKDNRGLAIIEGPKAGEGIVSALIDRSRDEEIPEMIPIGGDSH